MKLSWQVLWSRGLVLAFGLSTSSLHAQPGPADSPINTLFKPRAESEKRSKPSTPGADLASRLEDGMCAVAIPMAADQLAASYVMPGKLVTLMESIMVGEVAITRPVVSRRKVLRMIPDLPPPAPPPPPAQQGEPTEPPKAAPFPHVDTLSSIVLEVTPEEAQTLLSAVQKSRLFLHVVNSDSADVRGGARPAWPASAAPSAQETQSAKATTSPAEALSEGSLLVKRIEVIRYKSVEEQEMLPSGATPVTSRAASKVSTAP